MLEVRGKGVDFDTRFFHSSFLLHKKTLNLKKVALWPNYARNPEGRVAFFCPIFTGGQTHILLRDSSLAIPGFYCSQGCNSCVRGSESGRLRYCTVRPVPRYRTVFTGKLQHTWFFISKLRL